MILNKLVALEIFQIPLFFAPELTKKRRYMKLDGDRQNK